MTIKSITDVITEKFNKFMGVEVPQPTASYTPPEPKQNPKTHMGKVTFVVSLRNGTVGTTYSVSEEYDTLEEAYEIKKRFNAELLDTLYKQLNETSLMYITTMGTVIFHRDQFVSAYISHLNA
jgi:hypothetical protein